MKLEQELVEHMLSAPDTQLDSCTFETIKSWNNNPSALDILNLLDEIVYASLASEFVVILFRDLMKVAIEEEGTTYEELIKLRKKRD